MNRLPTHEEFKQIYQYYQCRGIQDEEHYSRLKSSENNKKDTERKVKRAVIDTINDRETFTKSTAVRSMTDAVCSHMGLVVQWSEAKGGHERPGGMPQSASKKPRSSGGSGGEVTRVRSAATDEGRSGNEDAPSTQSTAAPGTSLSTIDVVYYLISLAAQCFEKASLSAGGTQLNLRCGSRDP